MAIGPWGGFSNGYIPDSAMASGGGVPLKPSTAAQCNTWISRCAARGVSLSFGEGYRNFATQQYWLNYYDGDTSMAATPGSSNHGWGQAVDIGGDSYGMDSTSDAYRVIVEEGAACGMLPNISKEVWHFADVGTVTASLNVTPFPSDIPKPEVRTNDMIFIALEDSKGTFGGGTFYALFGGNKWVQIPDIPSANAIAKQFPGEAAARVSYETWSALQVASV